MKRLKNFSHQYHHLTLTMIIVLRTKIKAIIISLTTMEMTLINLPVIFRWLSIDMKIKVSEDQILILQEFLTTITNFKLLKSLNLSLQQQPKSTAINGRIKTLEVRILYQQRISSLHLYLVQRSEDLMMIIHLIFRKKGMINKIIN